MSTAILVDHVSKRYTISKTGADTMLRERIVRRFKQPFRRESDDTTLWALQDVSFQVSQGEVVGIIGRNGAGKSTLLKILSRITFPTTGSIDVRGRVAALLEVGTGFHEELTGRENVYLNGSILGMRRREIDSKLDEIVAFAGVERFIDTPIKRYSSGMRLRLGFAVAAHLDPDLLIIDEVLAVGDAAFQKKCLTAMEQLRGAGRTVLFVSHNMAAVENLCSRGIWIDNGRLRMDAGAHHVIESYMGTFANATPEGADLATVTDRVGTGEIRYTGLQFLTMDRQPKPVVRAGDSLVMRFHYVAAEDVVNPSFGFKLFTELGTLVTEVGTWHHGLDCYTASAGPGYIEIEIDSLNLMPARYSLSLWATGPGPHVFDGVDHCARLDVETADFYGSGRSPDGRSGVMFLQQRWNLDGVPMSSDEPLRPVSTGAGKNALATVRA
jgi:lipopolysaccharide transport system ATP-binding protein